MKKQNNSSQNSSPFFTTSSTWAVENAATTTDSGAEVIRINNAEENNTTNVHSDNTITSSTTPSPENNGVMADGLAPGGSPLTSNLVMMGVIMAVFYFIVFRPQQKRMREHQEMINKLFPGDRVMVSNSIVGVIIKKLEARAIFVVEIAPNVRIEVAQSSLSKIMEEQGNSKNIQNSTSKSNIKKSDDTTNLETKEKTIEIEEKKEEKIGENGGNLGKKSKIKKI